MANSEAPDCAGRVIGGDAMPPMVGLRLDAVASEIVMHDSDDFAFGKSW
ncbi:MAG: hypothetical protein HY023_14665 [Chloroflexi bacterium]|nr:hypothetical protein [Chloroflexota bacterium]MBI3764237.1 hypothetical protein [Chloroflexota bacterium]